MVESTEIGEEDIVGSANEDAHGPIIVDDREVVSFGSCEVVGDVAGITFQFFCSMRVAEEDSTLVLVEGRNPFTTGGNVMFGFGCASSELEVPEFVGFRTVAVEGIEGGDKLVEVNVGV